MTLPLIALPDQTEAEADFRRRWPPHKYPGLYLPPEKLHALKRRQRLSKRIRLEIRRVLPAELAAELPEAVEYIVRHMEVNRNGKPETHYR